MSEIDDINELFSKLGKRTPADPDAELVNKMAKTIASEIDEDLRAIHNLHAEDEFRKMMIKVDDKRV